MLPLVAQKSSYPDFMVLVSGAINWLDQGDYLTTNRLLHEGFSSSQVQQALRCNHQELQVLQPTSSYAVIFNTRIPCLLSASLLQHRQ